MKRESRKDGISLPVFLVAAGKTAPAKVLGLAWRLIPRLGLWGRMVPSADMAVQGSLGRDLYAPVAQLVEHRLS